MPRQFGKVDASTTWACDKCPHRHAPGSWCPPTGVWLVLALCSHCDPKTGRYCNRHRDRVAEEAPAIAPVYDIQMLRTGEGEREVEGQGPRPAKTNTSKGA